MTTLDERLAELHRLCTAHPRPSLARQLRICAAAKAVAETYLVECHLQWHSTASFYERRDVCQFLYRRVIDYLNGKPT